MAFRIPHSPLALQCRRGLIPLLKTLPTFPVAHPVQPHAVRAAVRAAGGIDGLASELRLRLKPLRSNDPESLRALGVLRPCTCQSVEHAATIGELVSLLRLVDYSVRLSTPFLE